MKRLFITLTTCAIAALCNAQTAKQEIAENPFLSASNHLSYLNQLSTQKLTPAPKGYEAFYFTHYGRHGSRWLCGDHDYKSVIEDLEKAQQAGKLTPKGEEVLEGVRKIYATSHKRIGDLTTVGERQHHGIGKRITENFPEIFKKKNVHIDARSTVVGRCILSMIAECEEFMAANPTATIHNDVSESLQYYLNQDWSHFLRKVNSAGDSLKHATRKAYTHSERIYSVLFTDTKWAFDNIDHLKFTNRLFDVASNMQSHDIDVDILSLFTADELYDLWHIRNVEWYISYGPSPVTKSLMPFTQYNLLRNIIATADTITETQATLRFGHEVCVMPLAALLELGDCGRATTDLDNLDTFWRNYRIFPMASNIQLIFYRPKNGKKGDILVKALLNEREMSMPVPSDTHPYYKWSDLRKYYVEKLDKFDAIEKGE